MIFDVATALINTELLVKDEVKAVLLAIVELESVASELF